MKSALSLNLYKVMPVEEQPIEQGHIDEITRQLLAVAHLYMSAADAAQVSQALQLILDSYQSVQSENPRENSYLLQLETALAVAMILVQMRFDAVCVSAGLVFEMVSTDMLILERIENELGSPVARTVGSMLRLNILERKMQSMIVELLSFRSTSRDYQHQKKQHTLEILRHQQSETVRKMFFAMSEDPRVILLKLAYRLHTMRMMESHKDSVDFEDLLMVAQEARYVYAPLAGRLRISQIERELEDLAFKVLEPEIYDSIYALVESKHKHRYTYVERISEILGSEMQKLGLHAEISGNVDHLYGIYKKIRSSKSEVKSFESPLLISFRILVDTTPDCYIALGHVHSLWRPKEGRIMDYIANPKPNGYSALHTTVFCLDNHLIEIQIRTYAMHEIAEYGLPMGRSQNEDENASPVSRKELAYWAHQLAEWQRDLRHSLNDDMTKLDNVGISEIGQEEQIFVFTPAGELRTHEW